MSIWPKRYLAAKALILGLLWLAVYTPRNVSSLSPLRANETALRYKLVEMRKAVDQYTLEHQRPPESLQDLVESQYLTGLPVDPMTGRSDWVVTRQPVKAGADIFVMGLNDVHSASLKVSTGGWHYDCW